MLAVALGVAAAAAPTLSRFEFSQPQMGTTVKVVLYAPNPHEARKAADAALARVGALDATLSDYRDDSELSRITREAVGRPVQLSDDLFRVLDASQELAARTKGAFDVTIGPLSRLWRRARRQIERPSDADLAAALAVTGYQFLSLDRDAKTVTVARPGMRLDAGGVAKGFAADEALGELKRRGLTRALVAVGGDLAVGDPPPGTRGWQIVLAGLTPERAAPGSPLTLASAGVSTSGDAEQWVEIDGQRYSHIVDPSTGLGLTGHRTVSVVAGSAMTSDMLATAVNVLTLEDGMAVVDGTPGAAALVGTSADGVDSWHRSHAWRW